MLGGRRCSSSLERLRAAEGRPPFPPPSRLGWYARAMPALRPLLSVLALAFAGCAQVEVPVWMIRADESLSVGEGERNVAAVLEDLHWEPDGFDPALRKVTTRWRHRDGVLGPVRSRVELRMKSDPPFAVAATVPREVHDGRGWVLRGEDEERREELIAELTARLGEEKQGRARESKGEQERGR